MPKSTTRNPKKDNVISNSSLTQPREKSKILPHVSALNVGQKEAIKAIADPTNHVVFVNGIAGTGKTYISCSWGLEQFSKGNFEKLVFTRPYVEAGENLGFLPGTFGMKIAPFMIPILDVLNEHLDADDIKKLMEQNKIVTLPIAYMRGVTFKNSFVLLDEGQNTTPTQMHLFLTRIGAGSKVVVTGDMQQSDIRGVNGFADAIERLDGVKGLSIKHLDKNAVVRHEIIPDIDARYVADNEEGMRGKELKIMY
jgi:phosphate starvation-inducible PhoH-like protein